MTKILIIEDDDAVRENLGELLEMEGYIALLAEDGSRGVELALRDEVDLIICDITMPGLDGFQVFEILSGRPETSVIPFIFLSARAARTDVRRGMALGADDFITKPFARTELLDSISTRLRRRVLTSSPPAPEQPGKSASTRCSGSDLSKVLVDEKMREIMGQLAHAATSSISVLLLGETGVGKEVLAREIHRLSGRSGAFVPVNCSALPEHLLESELFGHEKGAFTGAIQSRPGLFEASHGGTLFVDEVGEISLGIQVKLLRVLEDRQVMRIGARTGRSFDLRFVAATNRNLEDAMAAGEFRADLYYRLAGLTVAVPPLRDRPGDVLDLARSFVTAFLRAPAEVGFSPEAERALLSYHWPGNIRELRNVVERAVLLCDGQHIEVTHLPASLRSPSVGGPFADPRDPLLRRLEDLERARIRAALEQCGGNQTQAATKLGISRRTLVSRLSQFEFPRPRKRPVP